MKKKVKALIIATSVAAIAGIGAVSFAAWSAGSDGSAVGTAGTGNTVTTIGDIKLAYNGGTAAASITIDDKLIPYDQANSNAVLVTPTTGSNVTAWVLTVTNSAATETNVEYYIQLGGTALGDGAQLYYSTTATSLDKDTKIVDEGTVATGWTALTTTEAKLADFSSGDTIAVILAADGTAGKDISGITITVTAKQGAAA